MIVDFTPANLISSRRWCARRHRSGGAARVLPAPARRRALHPHRGGWPRGRADVEARCCRRCGAASPGSRRAGPTCRCSRRARASTRSGACARRSYGFVALTGKAAFARLAKEKRAAFLNPGFACGKQFVPDVIDRLAGGEKAVPAAGAGEHAAPDPNRRGRREAQQAVVEDLGNACPAIAQTIWLIAPTRSARLRSRPRPPRPRPPRWIVAERFSRSGSSRSCWAESTALRRRWWGWPSGRNRPAPAVGPRGGQSAHGGDRVGEDRALGAPRDADLGGHLAHAHAVRGRRPGRVGRLVCWAAERRASVFVVPVLLVALALPIVLLVVYTRPSVRATFERRAA